MKCPKCNSEMVDGYIPKTKCPIYFVPNNGGEWSCSYFSYGVNTIPLSKLTTLTTWKMEKVESYHCPSCKIVIIPVKDLTSKK